MSRENPRTRKTTSATRQLQAPFPWFGGKSRVAPLVWEAFGGVRSYVEPFAGSLAVLLGRPNKPKIETVNDKDGFIANFWRAIQLAPDEVAAAADWPVSEVDLYARHQWLVDHREELTASLLADPHFFDAGVAGWWVWGISQWIGGRWCSSSFKLVPKRLPHAKGNAGGMGVHSTGRRDHLRALFGALQSRLRSVRIVCGDWSRVMGPAVIFGDRDSSFLAGVFLDPPYPGSSGRDAQIYAVEDSEVGHGVRDWAIDHGDHPRLRIALCGYEGVEMPDTWTEVAWSTQGGYGNLADGRGRENASRERVWLSPNCLPVKTRLDLWRSE